MQHVQQEAHTQRMIHEQIMRTMPPPYALSMLGPAPARLGDLNRIRAGRDGRTGRRDRHRPWPGRFR